MVVTVGVPCEIGLVSVPPTSNSTICSRVLSDVRIADEKDCNLCCDFFQIAGQGQGDTTKTANSQELGRSAITIWYSNTVYTIFALDLDSSKSAL